MSTKLTDSEKFKLWTIHHISIPGPIDLVKTLNLVLQKNFDTSVTKMAGQAGVSYTAASNEIKNIKRAPKFRKEFERVVGDIPWD